MSYSELVKSTSLFCVTSTFDPFGDDVTMLGLPFCDHIDL